LENNFFDDFFAKFFCTNQRAGIPLREKKVNEALNGILNPEVFQTSGIL
jgi:hypothetical protein